MYDTVGKLELPPYVTDSESRPAPHSMRGAVESISSLQMGKRRRMEIQLEFLFRV